MQMETLFFKNYVNTIFKNIVFTAHQTSANKT